MQLGKKEECMADLAEAERILPNTADIYHHRGQLLVLLAKFTEAIDDLTKCIELRPDFASAK
jgi:import receptor subunit TOM70